MTSFICRPLLIIGLLSFGLASLLVPDFARLHHAIWMAFGLAALFALDALLAAEADRQMRRRLDATQFNDRLKVFLKKHGASELYQDNHRLN